MDVTEVSSALSRCQIKTRINWVLHQFGEWDLKTFDWQVRRDKLTHTDAIRPPGHRLTGQHSNPHFD